MQETQTPTSPDGPKAAPSRKPRRALRRTLRWTAIPLASLLGLLALVVLGLWMFLTPGRLTPMVEKMAGEYLHAELHFDTIQLSLFKHFPHITLEAKRGEIISTVFRDGPDSLRAGVPRRADSLLRFERFSLTLNANALLAKKIAIRRIALESPEAYAYVSPAGKANWEIYDADTTASDTTQLDWGLFVRRLMVRGKGLITYESAPDALWAQIELDSLTLRGRRDNRYKIGLACRASLQQDTLRLCDTLPLDLHGGFTFDLKQPDRVSMQELALNAAGLPAVLDGTLAYSADSVAGDLAVRMNPWELQRLIGLVPEQMAPEAKNVTTDLTADFNAQVRGSYCFASGKLPWLRLDCLIDKGSLRYRGVKATLDRLKLDMSAYYHPARPDSTGVVVRHLTLRGSGMTLQGSASAWNLEGNTRMQTDLEGTVDLDAVRAMYPLPNNIEARGTVGFKLKADVRKNQLNPRQIGQGHINASLDLDNFLLNMPEDTILLLAHGGRIRFGANESRQRREGDALIPPGEQVVYLSLRADSLDVNYKEQIEVLASGVRMRAQNAASAFGGDTTVIHPFGGSAEVRYLELNTLDSTWIKTEEATLAFKFQPSPENPAIPKMNLEVGAMGLAFKNQADLYQLHGTDLRLEASMVDMNRAGRRERMLDSLQQVYPAVPRDSLLVQLRARNQAQNRARRERAQARPADDFASEDIDMTVDKEIGDLLRKWNAKGSIYAIHGDASTPYFPLPTALKNVDIAFTTDEVDLNGTRILAGNSQMQLTGKIANLKRALRGRGHLRVDMKLVADTLDLNELILAANAGLLYAESDSSFKEQVIQGTGDNVAQAMAEADKAEAQTAGQSALIVIPSNVEATFDLEVTHGIYADIVLRSLTGEMTMRDRCLRLNELKAVTDVGEMDLTALYATRSRTDITAGFDLEMHRVKVDRLIDVLPSVDTLLPMLRSFEGVVDCELAATVALDTAMNFLLPTLQGVGRIHGDSMVLLDGETFTEIAKMMKFKNKKRNMIDHISVEMIIRDNQIELFPFVIEMDRYRAAVSGIQCLDMSFNYHISVLHSPLPFRLGVNIFGTPDKYKFRLGRARYKSINVPSYVELIDSTRLNLRQTLQDVFRRGVEAASLKSLHSATNVSLPSEYTAPEEGLSTADSLLLREQGILPGDTVLSTDSVSVAIPEVMPEPTKAQLREARKAQKQAAREARRNAEGTSTEEE